jgi:hypothetical protein
MRLKGWLTGLPMGRDQVARAEGRLFSESDVQGRNG